MHFENTFQKNKYFFQKTIHLAKKGRGSVFPNPEVGCVIVKNEEIIGEGFHQFFGGPHAEVEAINNAEQNGHSVENAEVYVSLEPCVHTNKKTPPCAHLLCEKKVKSVHILFQDPNPNVSGKGGKYLEEKGVPVFWADKTIQQSYKHFYDIFTHTITTPEPFITLKVAMDQKQCIGSSKERIFITEEECQAYTQSERDKYQAILMSRTTIENDNPQMKGEKCSPLRVMLTSNETVNPKKSLQFFRDENHEILSPAIKKSVLSKEDISQFCTKKNIRTIWAEGGKTMSEFFINQAIPQKIIFYRSPKTVTGNSLLFLDLKNLNKNYSLSHSFVLGNDTIQIWKKNIL